MSKPVYVLTFPGPVTAEDAETIRQRVKEGVGDAEAKVIVLGEGATMRVLETDD